MSLKLKRAINCHNTGSRVSIINGNNVEMILKAIRGEEYIDRIFESAIITQFYSFFVMSICKDMFRVLVPT